MATGSFTPTCSGAALTVSGNLNSYLNGSGFGGSTTGSGGFASTGFGSSGLGGATSTGFGSLSAVTASLRSFTLSGDNRLGRKIFVGDGTTFSNIGRGRRVTTFEAVIEGDSNGVTRFTEWNLGTEKRMRLEFAGSTISGSSPATAKQLWVDARIFLDTFDVLGEVDTNTVYRVTGRLLEDAAHSTTLSDLTLTLTNDQASYT